MFIIYGVTAYLFISVYLYGPMDLKIIATVLLFILASIGHTRRAPSPTREANARQRLGVKPD